MKARLPMLAVLLMSLVLMACGPSVNQSNYEKIQTDMSIAEVSRILGEPTDVSSFAIGELSATTARWAGKSHSITITFANDKVKMKTYTENTGSE